MTLSTSNRKTIVLLGDSITQQSFSPANAGWGAGLADWYSRYADVLNRGFSGYNSRFIRSMLDGLFPLDNPNNGNIIMTTVLLGSNDSVKEDSVQHVPLEEFESNVEAIVTHLLTVNPNMTVILITPPTVDHLQWPERHSDQVFQYAQAMERVAMRQDVALLNLWHSSNLKVHPITTGDLIDGLHLNEHGNTKIYRGLHDIITFSYQHICPENAGGIPNLPMHYPHWSTMANLPKEKAEEKLRHWRW